MMPTPEELEAHRRKSLMLADQPLEQARTAINGPLYGLTGELFDLECTEHIWQFGNCMLLTYLSPRYAQYRYKNDQTFVVTTRLFGEDEHPLFVLFSPVLQAGNAVFHATRVVERYRHPFNLAGVDRMHCFLAEKATFTIDGKSFKGDVTHYTAPVRYSSFTLYHGRIGLEGEALGPSIDELIQIMESLHDLNGKEVE